MANPDRVDKKHLWCDSSAEPTRLLIIDHDYALLGDAGDGIQRLTDLQDDLGLSFIKGSHNHHPFLRRIPSASLFDEWYKRAFSLPPWYIQEICREARRYGITKTEAARVEKFLLYRSRNLETIVAKYRDEFRSIADWSRGLF